MSNPPISPTSRPPTPISSPDKQLKLPLKDIDPTLALREHNRRNKEAEARSNYSSTTLTSLAFAPEYLASCSPTDLTSLKEFARHGGPDLTDVINFPGPLTMDNHLRKTRSQTREQQTGSENRNTRQPENSEGSKKRDNATKESRASEQPLTIRGGIGGWGGSAEGQKPDKADSTKTKNTSPYDNTNFRKAIMYGSIWPYCAVFPNGAVPQKPKNFDALFAMLKVPKREFIPFPFDQQDFEQIQRNVWSCRDEDEVESYLLPILQGQALKRDLTFATKTRWTKLSPLVYESQKDPDGKSKSVPLVHGNPDVYYGAMPGSLRSGCEEHFKNYIVPTADPEKPIIPNFVVAFKGPEGMLKCAQTQITYDGALAARAIERLQNYGRGIEGASSDDKAYTIACYCDANGKLIICTVYPTMRYGFKPNSRVQYLSHQLASYDLIGSIENLEAGMTAYRNARDWAKGVRDTAIKSANARWDRKNSKR